MPTTIEVETSSRVQFVDITADVRRVVAGAGIREGLCHVYVPHTTAGLTVNEGADPDVVRDILDQMEKIAPQGGRYRHAEGNADAHIRSALVGISQQLPVIGGNLALGTWQSVFFCEFDGPRRRRVVVTVTQAD
jgi:secondary thiamine-phosphate synthase enzyme